MLNANCRISVTRRRNPVLGTERTSGTEEPVMTDVLARFEPTGVQKLAVRQAGELTTSGYTCWIEPNGGHWPWVDDVVKVLMACYVNDPVQQYEGRRFDVTDMTATTAEIRLTLRSTDR